MKMEADGEGAKRLPGFLPAVMMLSRTGAAEEEEPGRGASNMEREEVRLVESTLNLRSDEEIDGSPFSSFPRSLEISCIANIGKLGGIIN